MNQQKVMKLMSELRAELETEMQYRSEQRETMRLKSSDLKALGIQMNDKRKKLQLDLLSLELQTGISSSTLKRLFKDPSQVKFISVLQVAEALGIKLCIVK